MRVPFYRSCWGLGYGRWSHYPLDTAGYVHLWLDLPSYNLFPPLGVDNIIQFSIVTANGTYLTANGTYLTANTYQNSGLFWALQGGGGGTYGIVTPTTYLTHPTVPLITSALTANFSTVAIAKTEFLWPHPQFAQASWGGYASISSAQLDFTYL